MAPLVSAAGTRGLALAAVVALLLAASGCSTSPALSGPRPPAASAAAKPAMVPPAAPEPTPAAPLPVVRLSPAPEAAVVRPAPAAPSPPQPRSDTIALILPLESAAYGRAAEAVKAGFLAAAERAGSGARVRVIGHGDDGVLPALAAATNGGVALVVGPLTRDDVKSVLALAPTRPRLLALNQADDGSPLPDDTFVLTLAIDADALLLADVAQADSVHSVALVATDGPLQQRFVAAFAAEWRRSGGAPPRSYRFDPNPEVLGQLRREIATRSPDAVVLAVDGDDAALAKSFLPPGPVYAISQIADGLPAPALRDLEGVRYVEIPWLADPDDPALARLPRGSGSNAGNPVIERLYALGLDAFALAQMLAEPVPPERIELDGATGHLTLATTHAFQRQGRVMEIRDGHPQPRAPGP